MRLAAKTCRAISPFFSPAIVSMSRPQCLALEVGERFGGSIWFYFPHAFFEAPCKTIEEMELVNALCRLAEYARRKST